MKTWDFLSLELKIPTSESSVSPYRRAANHSFLLGFHQNSAFTLPVLEFFVLVFVLFSLFQNPQVLGTPVPQAHSIPPGKGLATLMPFLRQS